MYMMVLMKPFAVLVGLRDVECILDDRVSSAPPMRVGVPSLGIFLVKPQVLALPFDSLSILSLSDALRTLS